MQACTAATFRRCSQQMSCFQPARVLLKVRRCCCSSKRRSASNLSLAISKPRIGFVIAMSLMGVARRLGTRAESHSCKEYGFTPKAAEPRYSPACKLEEEGGATISATKFRFWTQNVITCLLPTCLLSHFSIPDLSCNCRIQGHRQYFSGAQKGNHGKREYTEGG